MGLFRKLRKVIEVIFENESEQKGDDFEKYVVDLFDEKYFSIVQWTTDMVVFTISFFKDYIPLIINSIIRTIFVPAKKL